MINLTFHGVGRRNRRLEPGEDDVWVTASAFEAILDAVGGRTDVAITFDDGNGSDLEVALPALTQRGLRATFFVVAGRLDETGFLDSNGVRALADAGMTIGSHGMRHRPWRALDDGALNDELVAAQRVLQDAAGQPVSDAACPFGAYDRRVLHRLRRCGYRRVYTSDRGTARPADWLQARNTVRRGDGVELLTRASARRRPREWLLREAKLAAKRWR